MTAIPLSFYLFTYNFTFSKRTLNDIYTTVMFKSLTVIGQKELDSMSFPPEESLKRSKIM